MTLCAPAIHHSAETLKAWKTWALAHPFWRPAADVALACTKAAVIIGPLAGGDVSPWAYGGVPYDYPRPWLYGPAYEAGALWVPGNYEISPQGARSQLAANAVGGHASTEVSDHGARLTALGGSPIILHTPAMTEIQPATLTEVPVTSVPEPSSLMVLAGAVVAVVMRRRR